MPNVIRDVAAAGVNGLRDTFRRVTLKEPTPQQELPQDTQLGLECQGPSTLKSCLRRRQADDTTEGRQTESTNDSKAAGAKKSVRFNPDKRVRVFRENTKVHVFRPEEVGSVDGGPSPEWLEQSAARKFHERSKGHLSRTSGDQYACALSLRPNEHQGQAQTWGLLSTYLRGPLVDGAADVGLIHLSKDELLQKTFDAIEEMANGIRRFSSPPLTSTKLHTLKIMVEDARTHASLVFQRTGVLYPYHAGKETETKASWRMMDAEADGDFSEVENKASAMRSSCPKVATVRNLEGVLKDFSYWAKSTFGVPPETES